VIQGGYIEDIVLKILVDSRTNVCAKWFYTHSWCQVYYKRLQSSVLIQFSTMSDEPTTGCHALPSAPGQPLSSAMVAGKLAPIAVQLPSLASAAGQPLPLAMVAGQSAPIVGQSPSLAAVARQPLPSAMVAGQSDPISGQSPFFGCPALPSFE
jgi:hypothetical protein